MSILAVVGPTASGKTALAVAICRAHNGEIVGADASQVYRGLDIGTGKATVAELEGIEHHLIDIIEPSDHFDAAAYVPWADKAIEEARGRGRRVVLCGGTGLYLRGLIHGLCEAPPTPAGLRDALRTRISAGELPALHEELALVDPRAAQRIAPNDKQRIERALGVFLNTGKPLTEWQDEHRFAAERHQVTWLGVRWPKPLLEQRIIRRVDGMLEDGWVAEVEGLRNAGHRESIKSMQALGYRILSQHLDGELDLAQARERIIIATRRYAKRQMNWFKMKPEIIWLDGPATLEMAAPTLDTLWQTGGST